MFCEYTEIIFDYNYYSIYHVFLRPYVLRIYSKIKTYKFSCAHFHKKLIIKALQINVSSVDVIINLVSFLQQFMHCPKI